jgi:hypothetical protein
MSESNAPSSGGKGSRRRERKVSDAEYKANWDLIFTKKKKEKKLTEVRQKVNGHL